MIETVSDLTLQPRYLGLLGYGAGLRAQDEAVAEVAAIGGLGIVLGLEHRPVITLGKRGLEGEDLRATPEEIAAAGVELFRSPRGGQATLHSPGQLVIYPCVSLARLGCGVRDYVAGLERTTQGFLAELGIDSRPGLDEPGLYTADGKIAYFGVKISRGITSHGVSINVLNDLNLFGLIRSCGKDGESFDRIASHVPGLLLPNLFDQWISHFRETFRLTGA